MNAEPPRPVEPGELPREVEARVRTILRREARRLLAMRHELFDKHERGALSAREAEAFDLLVKERQESLSETERKRLSRLKSTWPWQDRQP